MLNKKWLLFGIVILAFVIRVYKVTELPLYGDELTLAYDSYSILKTGHDQTGEFLPLTFKMGAGRPGGYIYASLPFIAAFGPSALGIRLLSVLSGLGIAILIYFLGKKLFSEKVGVIALVLVAISPWDIYLSRGGFEAHFALFLALLGVTAFLYAKTNPRLYVVWAVSWGLTLLTYPTFKLTLPLITIPMFLYREVTGQVVKNKFFIVAVAFLAVFLCLVARETLYGGSEGRFLSVNLFADQNLAENITQKVSNERNISTLPQALKPIFINRQIEYGRLLLEGHVESISNNFLFLRGDRNPRHNPGEMGMLYLIELPLIFLALIYLSKTDKKILMFLTAWILIVPVATTFLQDIHSLRNSFFLPPFLLIIAYALSKIPQKFLYVIAIFYILQLVYLLQVIYFLVPNKFANFWSLPAKLAVEVSENKKSGYDHVVISTKIDNVEFAYPVYAIVEPSIVIGQYGKYPKMFGNVILEDPEKLELKGLGKTLVITEETVDEVNLIPGIKEREIGL